MAAPYLLGLPVTFRLRSNGSATSSPAALRARQSPHHISKQRIPPRQLSEHLRPRCSHMATLALERQNMPAEVIGNLTTVSGGRGAILAAIVASRNRGVHPVLAGHNHWMSPIRDLCNPICAE